MAWGLIPGLYFLNIPAHHYFFEFELLKFYFIAYTTIIMVRVLNIKNRKHTR